LVAVAASHWWRRVTNTHLVLLLLVIFGVFAVRDVWPLGTYTMQPADIAEGWLMWTKLAVLSFTALLIPLLIPRPYVPVDPKVCRFEFSIKASCGSSQRRCHAESCT
jgi:hypothetical protein